MGRDHLLLPVEPRADREKRLAHELTHIFEFDRGPLPGRSVTPCCAQPLFSRSVARLPAESRRPGSLESRRPASSH
jgi:hypothetical protein